MCWWSMWSLSLKWLLCYLILAFTVLFVLVEPVLAFWMLGVGYLVGSRIFDLMKKILCLK